MPETVHLYPAWAGTPERGDIALCGFVFGEGSRLETAQDRRCPECVIAQRIRAIPLPAGIRIGAATGVPINATRLM